MDSLNHIRKTFQYRFSSYYSKLNFIIVSLNIVEYLIYNIHIYISIVNCIYFRRTAGLNGYRDENNNESDFIGNEKSK